MDHSLRLCRPSMALREGFFAMLAAYRARQDRYYRDAWSDPSFDLAAYIHRQEQYSRGEGLPEGRVPTTMFWLTDGGHVYGTARLRHSLNEGLLNEGGHIGYDVNPLFRRRGYGTMMLKLMLAEAKKIGIDRALVTCDSDNEGSRRIIEKNGGVCESEYVCEDGKRVLRFWIDNRDGLTPGDERKTDR